MTAFFDPEDAAYQDAPHTAAERQADADITALMDWLFSAPETPQDGSGRTGGTR